MTTHEQSLALGGAALAASLAVAPGAAIAQQAGRRRRRSGSKVDQDAAGDDRRRSAQTGSITKGGAAEGRCPGDTAAGALDVATHAPVEREVVRQLRRVRDLHDPRVTPRVAPGLLGDLSSTTSRRRAGPASSSCTPASSCCSPRCRSKGDRLPDRALTAPAHGEGGPRVHGQGRRLQRRQGQGGSAGRRRGRRQRRPTPTALVQIVPTQEGHAEAAGDAQGLHPRPPVACRSRCRSYVQPQTCHAGDGGGRDRRRHRSPAAASGPGRDLRRHAHGHAGLRRADRRRGHQVAGAGLGDRDADARAVASRRHALRRRLRRVDRRPRRAAPIGSTGSTTSTGSRRPRGGRDGGAPRRPDLVGPPRLERDRLDPGRRRLVPRAVRPRDRRQAAADRARVRARRSARRATGSPPSCTATESRPRPPSSPDRLGTPTRWASSSAPGATSRRGRRGGADRPGPGLERRVRALRRHGDTLELLDPAGTVVRTLGAGAGLVAATAQPSAEPTWLVTGTDTRRRRRRGGRR